MQKIVCMMFLKLVSQPWVSARKSVFSYAAITTESVRERRRHLFDSYPLKTLFF